MGNSGRTRQQQTPILKNKSFYCGGAAGRRSPEVIANDFSNSDREYAENIGLTFFTPEAMFRKGTKIDTPIPTSLSKRNEAGELQGTDIALRNNLVNKENMLEMASVRLEGIRHDINSNVKRLMFEGLGKVSSKEDTHAYIIGIAEHDPSRLFDKSALDLFVHAVAVPMIYKDATGRTLYAFITDSWLCRTCQGQMCTPKLSSSLITKLTSSL